MTGPLIPQEWLDKAEQAQRDASGGFKRPNPCINKFGRGPEGRKCKDCALLRRRSFSKTYIKCIAHGDTASAKTDHLAGWPACIRFLDTKRTEPMLHVLKIQEPHYTEQAEGRKRFELRQEDTRYFIAGDVLKLVLWPLDESAPHLYRRITHVLRGPCHGLAEGWVILSTRQEALVIREP